MTTSPAEQLVGAVLNGRFRLVRLLGEGGMGAVYETCGVNGEGSFAVKLLHQEFVKEEPILARFFAEAQTMRALTHPNITRIFETATAENGTPYLVMELLTGTPLSSYVEKKQSVPPAQAVNIIYGVLQALKAAHTRAVVHRDLKPDNLFLVPDANGVPNVKVLDFGIAKVMDVAGGMGQKTRTGVLLGTPGYMSPEQVKNSKAVDPRSDLWSVGIILFELLTGTPPFPGDNEFARLTSVLSEEPKSVTEAAPHLAHWTPFFTRAFQKEPAQRFQSADEMSHAMLAAARGNTSMTPPPPSALQGASPYAAVLGAGVQQHSGLMPSPMSAASAPVQQHSGLIASPMSVPYPLVQQHSGLIPAPTSAAYPPVQQHSGLIVSPVSPGPTQQSSGPPLSPALSTPRPPGIEPSGLMAGPMSAIAAISAPMSRPAPNYPSQPPPSMQAAQVSPALAVGPTHISAQAPPGLPPIQDKTPSIQIVDAPPLPGVAHWVVAVVGFVCFGLGLALGLMLH